MTYSNVRMMKLFEASEVMDLFDFTYDLSIFDKDDLEEMYILKYGEREIGYETVVQFARKLKSAWKIKLYKYNKLFELYNESLESNLDISETTTATAGTTTDSEDNTFIPSIDGSTVPTEESKDTSESNTSTTTSSTFTKQGRENYDLSNTLKNINSMGNPLEQFIDEVAKETLACYQPMQLD